MAKDFDPHRLDIRRFAEEGADLEGSAQLRGFARLLAEAEGPDFERAVHWHARGELLHPRHHSPDVWVHLEAQASLPLACQRCLGPVEVKVEVRRSFRFVADEATAAAQDDQSEEDLLVLSRTFDLVELVEDELLMELPVAPRHEVCPEPVKMSTADAGFDTAEPEKEHPFAVLGRLKTGK